MRKTIGQKPTHLPTAVLTPSPDSHITTLGFITRNRPEALARAVQSYVQGLMAQEEEQTDGRVTHLLILDDSDQPAACEANLTFLQETAPQAKQLTLQYANPADRLAFVQKLIAQDIAPPDIIRFGLDKSDQLAHAPRAGVNRNALLLASGGEMLFSADDDTLFDPVRRAPFALDVGVGVDLVLDEDPAEKFVWETEAEALAAPQLAAGAEGMFDFWREQAAVLGKTGKELTTAVGISLADLDALPAELAPLAQRLQAPESRVVATFNGLVGDNGLGFPFGFTGTAVGCLLPQTAATHHALTHDEAHYQMALTSRTTLRIPPRLTLSDGSYSMTTFVGLDNRHLLPPFMPLFRAQDMIWGQTVWRSDNTAVLAHLPLALRHAPLDPRRFWPGEFMRSATGYDTTRLVLDCVMAYVPPPPTTPHSPRDGLIRLGQYLQELGTQSLPNFAHFVQQQAHRRNEQFLASIETTLDQYEHQPTYWATDLQQYMQTMRRAMRADEYIVPVDLRVNYPPRQALEMGQLLIRLFGEWLIAWPDIVATSQALRQKGEGLGRVV